MASQFDGSPKHNDKQGTSKTCTWHATAVLYASCARVSWDSVLGSQAARACML